ncbi:MAG TPA: AAA family ATPase, partial [Bryobacteraceae bacterium]|nr:AAA family ATPase [Bryobacteraceae bacterium]
GLGNQIDFKNTIIIMTSNIGARLLEKRNNLGFSAPPVAGVPSKIEDQVRAEVKRSFNPEFLNRLDDIILFTSLTDEDLLRIIDLLVAGINKNLEPRQITIRLNVDASKYILEKTCTDRNYGARPLRRALQKFIEDPLSEALIQGTLPKPADLEIYLGETGLYYRVLNQVPAEVIPAGAGGVAEAEPEATQAPGVPLFSF